MRHTPLLIIEVGQMVILFINQVLQNPMECMLFRNCLIMNIAIFSEISIFWHLKRKKTNMMLSIGSILLMELCLLTKSAIAKQELVL